MRYNPKIIAVTAVSTAAAVGLYTREQNPVKKVIREEEILVENALNSGPVIKDSKYESAIKKSLLAVNRVKTEYGLPGIVVGVSVNGETVWAEGFGLANVETATPCDAKTKMRIASISKPITMALLAKLMERGDVDVDKPIQEYVKYFPKKIVDGKERIVTARLLACHKAGIRHYKASSVEDPGPEFYSKDRFTNVEESVNLFKDDDLLFAPDQKYHYSTHGFTLLSAVIEGAVNIPFDKQLRTFLDHLGLKNTHLDEIPTLIYGRASYYIRDKTGKLKNAELADNSNKWAGGGLVSNVGDLLKFANTMLYSFQHKNSDKPGYLKPETVELLWTIVPGTVHLDSGYGLGWSVSPAKTSWYGLKEEERFSVGHGGGAVGASSVLLIFPVPGSPPSGISVAILTNMQNVSLISKLGKEIGENFIKNNA